MSEQPGTRPRLRDYPSGMLVRGRRASPRRAWCWAAALLLAATATPTSARLFDEAGGWRIELEEEGGYCMMFALFEGPGKPALTLILRDRDPVLIYYNDGWANSEDRAVPIRITFDQGRVFVPTDATTRRSPNPNLHGSGVGFTITAAALDDLRRSKGMRIYMEGRLIGQFDLTGTAQAVARTEACLDVISSKDAKRREPERP